MCRSQYIHRPTSARAWGILRTENGSSPRAQGVRREVGGKGGSGSQVDSDGSRLVRLKAPGASLPCTVVGLFAFLLWLRQAWAQQVTQTLQSPTSQPGLSCWVGLDPLSLIPNSLPGTQRTWCDRTQAKLTLRRPPTPAPLLTATFNGHQWPRVRTARIPPTPAAERPALGLLKFTLW